MLKIRLSIFLNEDKVLIIFPDKPFWFVSDKSVLEILDFFI